MDHVLGFFLVNDVSERNYQKNKGLTWDKGKGFDTFGPIGPYIVTKDELPDFDKLNMYLDVNGERMQTGNTEKMIFGVKRISIIYEFMYEFASRRYMLHWHSTRCW